MALVMLRWVDLHDVPSAMIYCSLGGSQEACCMVILPAWIQELEKVHVGPLGCPNPRVPSLKPALEHLAINIVLDTRNL